MRRPPRSTLFPYRTLVRSSVRVVATVIRSATPSAPPICWLVLMSPEARPASRSPTPASAAMEIGTNEKPIPTPIRSEEHTSELQSRQYLVCRLLLETNKHSSDEFLSSHALFLQNSRPYCYSIFSSTSSTAHSFFHCINTS